VAPFSIAQDFIAEATVSAIAGSSANPCCIVCCSLLKTSAGSRCRMTSPVKVSVPKNCVDVLSERRRRWRCASSLAFSIGVILAVFECMRRLPP